MCACVRAYARAYVCRSFLILNNSAFFQIWYSESFNYKSIYKILIIKLIIYIYIYYQPLLCIEVNKMITCFARVRAGREKRCAFIISLNIYKNNYNNNLDFIHDTSHVNFQRNVNFFHVLIYIPTFYKAWV